VAWPQPVADGDGAGEARLEGGGARPAEPFRPIAPAGTGKQRRRHRHAEQWPKLHCHRGCVRRLFGICRKCVCYCQRGSPLAPGCGQGLPAAQPTASYLRWRILLR